MASTASLAATVHTSSATIAGAAETSLTVPTLATVVFTAGASGSKIEEIVVEGVTTSLTPTTSAGLVYVFIYDGSTYHLYDTITVTAVTASATVAPYRGRTAYTNLWIPSGSSIRCSQSIAGNAGLLKVTILGGDF